MLYEIWIDNFRLPVIPKEINPYEENEVSSVTIDGFGEISKTTNSKVRTFELSSFFYDPVKGKPPYAKEYTISVNSLKANANNVPQNSSHEFWNQTCINRNISSF